MDKSIITFSANEQNLQKTGGIGCYASDTVSYIEAHFALGENWSGYDSIRAVWFNDYKTISTVLDSDGVCIVPHEVLVSRGKVMVNLVGSVLVSDELSDRLTTFPCEALKVSAKAKISGSETAEITPSQFEQFVSIVISEVEKVTGMTAQAETLPAGSQATARYENGILYLGIPQGIRGERGETGADGADGNGIASVVYNADYSLTLIFDNGERFTTPPIRGERGPAGADGRDGTDGADGVTPNISIGNVETLEPSEDAYVTRRGTDDNPIFDFGIPKGDPGEVTMSQLSSLLPTDTASGSIASFPDGTDLFPALSVKAQIEPIQSGSGTPSPDNVRPISGHTEVDTEVCGKNLMESVAYATALYSAVPYRQSGTAISSPYTTTADWSGVGFFAPVKAGITYSFSSDLAESGTFFYGIYMDFADTINRNNVLESGRLYSNTFTPSYDGCVVVMHYAQTAGTIMEWNYAQLEVGSSATSYEPYQSTSYTTTLGRTVYGGTLDVVSGELVVDRAMVDLSSLSWSYQSTWDSWYTDYIADVKGTNTGTETPNFVSDRFEAISTNAGLAPQAQGFMGITSTTRGSSGCRILVKNGNTTESPIGQLCYELATPQTYQLTRQTISLLHGNNNVWSDGEVELTYNADVGLYIDKKLGTSGTRTLSMTRTLDTKSEETETKSELTKSDNIQLAED